MPATPVYHVGLLVHDVEASKARLAEVLNLSFQETQTFRVDLEWDGESHPTDVTFAYSVEGPPFVELIQAQDNDGPFGRAHGEGLHHIAIWETSLEERLRRLESLGAGAEVLIRGEGGQPIAAYLPASPVVGMRVELALHHPGMPGYTPELPGTGQ